MHTQKFHNNITLELVLILPGRFMMGSPDEEEDRDKEEGLQHLVEIKQPFYLGKYLITQGQWKTVMGNNPSFFTRGDHFPVENISWDDCQEFLKKLNNLSGKNYRLPSEAEWEYACRAGTTTSFNFGETISTKIANYNGLGTYEKGEKRICRGTTTPVGSFPPNGFGLYDMHGNLWEWCEDGWEANYIIPRTQKPYNCINTDKVLRGGSWYNHPRYCRSAFRLFFMQDGRGSDHGFRIAHSIR